MSSGSSFRSTTTLDSDDEFLFTLSRYALVDIGIVTALSPEGRMTVDTHRPVNRITKKYYDVEPLYIGNTGGIIRPEAVGSICILLVPQTAVHSFTDDELVISASPYSTLGIKGILVTDFSPHEVEMSIQANGSIAITGSQYSMTFSKDGIEVADEEQKNTVRLEKDGSVSSVLEGGLLNNIFGQDGTETHIRFNADGIIVYYSKRTPDGAETVKRLAYKALEPADWDDLDSFTNWQYIEARDPDGTYIIHLFDADEHEIKEIIYNTDGSEIHTLYDTDENVVWQLKLSADGSSLGLTIGSGDDKNQIDITNDGITVTDLNNNVVEMTSSGMKLTDKNDNVIEMKDGEIDITGTKVVINADVELKKKLDVAGDTTMAKLTQKGQAALGES